MNEQGARHFDRYEDSDGAILRRGRDRHLGRGDRRDGAASSARRTGVAFSLRQVAGRAAVSRPGADRLTPGLVRLRLLPAADDGAVRLRHEHRGGLMTSVLLIYPFFRRSRDRSRFRFPPLGVAYVAASLQAGGPRRAPAGLHLPAPRGGPGAGAGGAGGRRRHLLHGDDGRGLPVVRRRAARPLRAAGRRGPAADVRPRRVPRSTSTPSCAARASRPCVELLAAHEAGADVVRASVPRGRRAGDAVGARRPPPRPFARDLDAHPVPGPRPAAQRPLHRLRQAQVRLLHHHRDEHPRLPLPLRVLQQRRLRRLLPGAFARERGRRGRGGPATRLRPHLVRRRRVHAEPQAGGRDLRGDRAPRPALRLGVPGPRRHLRRRDRRGR